MERITFQSQRISEMGSLPGFTMTNILVEKSTDLMTAILKYLRRSLVYFRHSYFHNLGKTVLLGPQIYASAKTDLDIAIKEYDQALLVEIVSSVTLSGFHRQIVLEESRYEIFVNI